MYHASFHMKELAEPRCCHAFGLQVGSPKASAVYTIRPGIQRCLGISSTCVEVDKMESFRFHYQCIQCIKSNLPANHFRIILDKRVIKEIKINLKKHVKPFQSIFLNWWMTAAFLQLRLISWSQGDHAHSPSAHSVWAETVNSAMDQVSISFPERSSTIHSISCS